MPWLHLQLVASRCSTFPLERLLGFSEQNEGISLGFLVHRVLYGFIFSPTAITCRALGVFGETFRPVDSLTQESKTFCGVLHLLWSVFSLILRANNSVSLLRNLFRTYCGGRRTFFTLPSNESSFALIQW